MCLLPCLFNCSLRPSTNHKSLPTDSASASSSRIPEGPDLLGMLIEAAVSMISGCPLCWELPSSNLKLSSRFGSVGKTLMPARVFRMGLQSDIDSLGAGRAGNGLGFKLNPVISRSCKQCWSSVWGYNVVGGEEVQGVLGGGCCRRVPRQSIDRPDSGASSGTLAC